MKGVKLLLSSHENSMEGNSMTQKVQITEPLSVFGEMLTVHPTPEVQIDATHGLRSVTDTEVFTSGGTATVVNSGTGYEFKCTTGTSVGGYGLIRSRRFVKYRPGQGAYLRLTARWPTVPPVLGTARAGGVATGTELSFGYSGGVFGILYRTGGLLECRTLTLSAGAGGNETVTVTLNGTAFQVAVTSGSAAATATQIAAGTFTGWLAYQNGSTVLFVAQSVGAKSGTYSLSSTGTTAGTFAQTIAGVAVTDTFVPQTSWNVDKCDGRTDSGFLLDPAKGNVFQIQFQYLGYGEIIYSIEHPGTGRFHPVHRIQYSNANTAPSLLQPALKVGWFAASLGSTTDFSLLGASAMGGVEGEIYPLRNPYGQDNSKSSVGTTLTSIISIRNRSIFAGAINVDEVLVKLASVAVEGTKPAIVEVWLNATLGGTPNWTYNDEANSTVEYDTAATTCVTNSSAQLVATLSLAKSASDTISFSDFGNVRLNRLDVLTIAVKATSGTTDVTAGFIWIEE